MMVVTGGSGMVGTAMKQVAPTAFYPTRSELMSLAHSLDYVGGAECMIHLAARVGGVKANTDFVADFYSENHTLNQYVMSLAHNARINKLISLLSTCVYPDAPYVTYPLTEDQLHAGVPHHSNFGYAYAKRMVDVMSRAYRQQYGCNFITAIPNNLYGENDNYNLQDGHVIPALMRKIWEAKLKEAPFVMCWGDGSAFREFTYAPDIASILLFLAKNYDEATPINIGNTEEHSIKEVVNILCELLEYDGEIIWDTSQPTGQVRKPSSNKKLLDLGWKTEDYTPLKAGLIKSYKWFKINYPQVRGI